MTNNASSPPATFSNHQAFTLIELMVVVAVMATLAGLVFASMHGMGQNAKRKTAGVRIAALELGLEMYRQDHGDFPVSETDPDLDPHEGAIVLYQALSGDGNTRLNLVGGEASIGELGSSQKAYMEQLDAKRNPSKMVLHNGRDYFISDPWRQPFRYTRYEERGNRQSAQRNPASYDLYTHGKTAEEEAAEGASGRDEKKWITNWN